MSFEPRTDHWLGLVAALGVLLALFLWYALPRANARQRGVVVVFAALMFLGRTAGALRGAASVGSRLTFPDFLHGGDATRWFAVVLALVGLGAGLAFALADRDPEPEPEAEAAEAEAEPDDVTMPHVSLPSWVTPSRRLTLAAAVAIALPVGHQETGYVVSVSAVVGLLLSGLIAGSALLFVALVGDEADVRWTAGAFGLVALGFGLVSAWPDTFSELLWVAFATGLVAGLLLPAGLRLLRRPFVDDRVSLVWGVLLAVAVVGGSSAALAHALTRNFLSAG